MEGLYSWGGLIWYQYFNDDPAIENIRIYSLKDTEVESFDSPVGWKRFADYLAPSCFVSNWTHNLFDTASSKLNPKDRKIFLTWPGKFYGMGKNLVSDHQMKNCFQSNCETLPFFRLVEDCSEADLELKDKEIIQTFTSFEREVDPRRSVSYSGSG